LAVSGAVAATSGSIGRKCALPSFSRAYEYSSAVFVGVVLSESKVGDIKEYKILVKRYWKGVKSKKVELSVYENRRFQAQYKEGRTYLIFAREDDDGRLIDGRCSRSSEIGGYSSNLKGDLEKLGEAKTCIDLKEEEGVEVEKEN
jgi:hypothetical protein